VSYTQLVRATGTWGVVSTTTALSGKRTDGGDVGGRSVGWGKGVTKHTLGPFKTDFVLAEKITGGGTLATVQKQESGLIL